MIFTIKYLDSNALEGTVSECDIHQNALSLASMWTHVGVIFTNGFAFPSNDTTIFIPPHRILSIVTTPEPTDRIQWADAEKMILEKKTATVLNSPHEL